MGIFWSLIQKIKRTNLKYFIEEEKALPRDSISERPYKIPFLISCFGNENI